mgnify:CR=1 FL=1
MLVTRRKDLRDPFSLALSEYIIQQLVLQAVFYDNNKDVWGAFAVVVQQHFTKMSSSVGRRGSYFSLTKPYQYGGANKRAQVASNSK